ncbi:hypothetical protein LTS18_014432, partial [Coniosporium uncinatum]
ISIVPGPTQTVPGPVQTVPGPVQTVPGPIQTVPGPVQTVPGPIRTVPGTVSVLVSIQPTTIVSTLISTVTVMSGGQTIYEPTTIYNTVTVYGSMSPGSVSPSSVSPGSVSSGSSPGPGPAASSRVCPTTRRTTTVYQTRTITVSPPSM